MSKFKNLEELAGMTRSKIIEYAKTRFGKPIVEDLGDYIPFLDHFGETELCKNHISECSNQIFSPSLPTAREDTLLGLIEHYRWTGDEAGLELAKRYVDYLFSNYAENGRLVIPVGQFVDHVFEYDRPQTAKNKLLKPVLLFIHHLLGTQVVIPRNGIFIELLTDIHDLTQEKRFLDMAESFALSWLQNKIFKRFGLFPSFRLNPFKGKYAVLAKDNSALLNGLIAVYNITHKEAYKEAILKWCRGVHERCFDATLYGKYYFDTGHREAPELMYAMAVVDVLCYTYFVLKEKWTLSFAEEIAKFWMDLQSQIGLFPMAMDSYVSHQDYTNDFSISLWRLCELTGRGDYCEAALNAMKGLFKFHVFHRMVDYKTGNPLQSGTIPKYVFLMSKPIILLQEKAIYETGKVFKLLRDR